MSKKYFPGFVLLGVMAMLAVGKGRLSASGHASGGGGEGCAWEPPVEVGAQPTASTSSSAQPLSVAARRQSSLARYGDVRAIARMPERHRALAAQAVAELAARPGMDGLDPEQVSFRLQPGGDGVQRMNLRQHISRVPVFGVEAHASLDEATQQMTVNGTLLAGVKVDTTPKISEADAVARALASVACADCKPEATRGQLFVLRHGEVDHLVYRVWPRLGHGEEKHPMVFVDAHSGEIVRSCPAEEPACFDRD